MAFLMVALHLSYCIHWIYKACIRPLHGSLLPVANLQWPIYFTEIGSVMREGKNTLFIVTGRSTCLRPWLL